MYCKNCGANVPENANECPFCNTKVVAEANEEVATDVVQQQAQDANSLLGKYLALAPQEVHFTVSPWLSKWVIPQWGQT